MNKFFKILALIVFIGILYCFWDNESKPFEEESYIKKTANEKKDALWSKLIEDKNSNGWYNPLATLVLFLETMKISFTHFKDSFPRYRKKYIHSVGTVGQFEIISTSNKFSGVFKGCKNVIGRLSCAKKPDESKTNPQGGIHNFTPGMALKCLRSGIHSADFIAMYSVEGQESWNFFKNDFTNHIEEVNDIKEVSLKLLANKFSAGSPFIATLGTKDLARYDENGHEEKEIRLPFSLVFKPKDKFRNGLPDTFQENFLDTLTKIEHNQVLYDIYANNGPDSPLEKIAELKLVSKMVTSKYGDKHLFFRHNLWEDDINLRPEWEEARHKFGEILNNRHHGRKADSQKDDV